MSNKYPTVHIIHGIHNGQSHVKAGLGKFVPYFKDVGMTPIIHSYGYALAATARWQNPGRAEKILPHIKNGDIAVVHSNGAAIAKILLGLGAPLAGLVLINAALDRDTQFEEQVKWIHVYHNSGDRAVSWSRLLLLHPWGDMGKHGYNGIYDPRIKNFNGDILTPKISGHSDLFSPEKFSVWGPRIVTNVVRSL